MKKFMDVLQKYLVPFAAKLDQNKIVAAMKDGMVATVPVTIIGALAMIVTYFPYLDKFAPNVSLWLNNNVSVISTVTISMITVTIIVATACGYAKQLHVEALFGVTVAFIAFFMLADFSYVGAATTAAGEAVESVTVTGVIPLSALSSGGVFVALVTTIVSIKLYAVIQDKNFTIKLPDAVPPNVAGAFTSLIPMFVVCVVFAVIRDLFALTPWGYFPAFLNDVLARPLLALGDSVWAIIVIIFVQQLLWWFGIHGSNVVRTVWGPILLMMMTANMEAFAAGEELPYIVSQTFWNVYSGAFFFSIPLALLLFCKSARGKSMGKASIGPAVFVIHEPVLFGLPVVLNPILFIPFVFVYILQFVVVYVLAMVGIAPIPIAEVPWTTPIIFSGFLSTNFNIMGALVQVLVIVLGVIGYYPFIKALDKQYLAEEKKNEELTAGK